MLRVSIQVISHVKGKRVRIGRLEKPEDLDQGFGEFPFK
jgi:hypothetical protein